MTKDGKVIIYHKNGQPQSVGNFVKGIAHGPIIVYDSNGHELYRGMFKDGKPSGEWVFTNPKTMKKQLNLIKNSYSIFDMIIFYVITILFLFIL